MSAVCITSTLHMFLYTCIKATIDYFFAMTVAKCYPVRVTVWVISDLTIAWFLIVHSSMMLLIYDINILSKNQTSNNNTASSCFNPPI